MYCVTISKCFFTLRICGSTCGMLIVNGYRFIFGYVILRSVMGTVMSIGAMVMIHKKI